MTDLDKRKIEEAISNVGAELLLDKKIQQLSDGERQKVMLARALAQDTPIIFLDEPTAHLDLLNRVEMMRLLRNLARKTQKAILLTTHELDLALQTADKLWLLSQGGQLTVGVPEDLILDGSFEAIFSKKDIAFDQHSGTFTVFSSQNGPSIFLTGHKDLTFWTRRALQRQGFSVDNDPAAFCKVTMLCQDGQPVWEITSKREITRAISVESLMKEVKFAFDKSSVT